MLQDHRPGNNLLRIALIVFVLFVTSLPQLFGLFHKPAGTFYTGIRSLNATDYNQHLAFFDQCRKGKFFLNNPYISDPHEPYLIRPSYFIFAIPFRVSEVSNTVAFQIIRLICGFLLLLLLFPLINCYVQERGVTYIAFLLLSLTSGLGIILGKWLPDSVDLKVSESILFLTLGGEPHHIFSLLILWSGLTAIYLAITRREKWIWLYFTCLLILWWDHPFDAVTLIGVGLAAGIPWLSNRNRILMIAGTILLSIFPPLYFQKLFSMPAFATLAGSQNLMSTPSPLSVLEAFVPLMMLGIPGAVQLWRSGNRRLVSFLLIWIGVQLCLIYLPVNFQRRILAGLQFPFAILAASCLARIRRPLIIGIVIVALTATNIRVTQNMMENVRTRSIPFYLPVSYWNAFEWLAHQHEGAVLSGIATGNFVPAYTGMPAFMGHNSFTPDWFQRMEIVRKFYGNPSYDFVKQNHIEYIVVGAEERPWVNPKFDRMFRQLYHQTQISIYSASLR